jgi:hypothetical protein
MKYDPAMPAQNASVLADAEMDLDRMSHPGKKAEESERLPEAHLRKDRQTEDAQPADTPHDLHDPARSPAIGRPPDGASRSSRVGSACRRTRSGREHKNRPTRAASQY